MVTSVAAVGAEAPGFGLKDQNDKEVTLAGLAGKKVVLSFHPLAWTSVCTIQMQDLERNSAEFAKRGAVPLGVSVDSVPCKAAWAKAIGLSVTRILSDFWPHGGVAQAYGIFRERHGTSERAVIIVDPKGRVAWTKVYPINRAPDVSEILSALEGVR